MSDIQALQSAPQQKFERDDTKAVKGIAVLLMLFHHLAGFPDRFPVGFDGFSSILPVPLRGGVSCRRLR